jgi:uncharacterized membrane protein
VALYGLDCLLAGVAYYLLSLALVAHHGADSTLAQALGRDLKGKASVVIYALSVPLAFLLPAASVACYVAVALMWLLPDRRIERALA